MTVLVVGATGELGGRVAGLLRDRAETVRCLVRPGKDGSALEQTGAEVVHGDLLEPGSLDPACAGADVVVCTATAIARLLAGAGGGTISAVDGDGVGSLVASAERSGVKRFVYLSYCGVDAGLGFPLERAKAENEQRLRASRMREVIVRPDAFQELHLGPIAQFDVAGGRVAIFGRGETKRRYVAIDDVAALVASLASETEPPALVEVGGPDALTKNEAATLAERLTGRPLKIRRMPRPAVRLGARVLARPKPALASVFGLGLMMDLHESRCDDAPLRERGIQPGTVEAHFRRLATPIAEA
jgi:uncharacterized protein YbjT (DUF2867 family)